MNRGIQLFYILNFYNFYERVTLGASESVCSGDLPAGAIVIGGNLTVVTADTNNIDITKVGSQDQDNDDDKYSGTIALDAQVVGATVQLVPLLLPGNQGATSPALTHGSANGDGVVDLNLFYVVVT